MTTLAAPATASRPPCWGSVTSGPPRYGVCRSRLVVLAPGSSAGDAWRWRLAAAAPWAGAVLAIVGLAVASSLLGPAAGAAVVLGGAAAGFLLVAHLSAPVRRAAHELVICTGLTPDPLPSASAELLFWEAVERLQAADEALRAGRIDRAQHEVAWSAVWCSLPERAGSRP